MSFRHHNHRRCRPYQQHHRFGLFLALSSLTSIDRTTQRRHHCDDDGGGSGGGSAAMARAVSSYALTPNGIMYYYYI